MAQTPEVIYSEQHSRWGVRLTTTTTIEDDAGHHHTVVLEQIDWFPSEAEARAFAATGGRPCAGCR